VMSTAKAKQRESSASFRRPKVRARLRIELDDDIAIGPGKADLLDGIRASGSIAAAGRGMGMSYKRAWQLVESMNGCFKAPLVEATKGGHSGGGAQLTALGVEVLARYRHMEAETKKAIERDVRSLMKHLAD